MPARRMRQRGKWAKQECSRKGEDALSQWAKRECSRRVNAPMLMLRPMGRPLAKSLVLSTTSSQAYFVLLAKKDTLDFS